MNSLIRNQFPFLKKNIIYLDSATTSLKPQAMIDAEVKYYSEKSFNVLRTSNVLTKTFNEEFSSAIKNISSIINADAKELVFTNSATFAANEIALFVSNEINEGDEIIISPLEHASNYLPWVKLSKDRKAKIKYYEVNEKGLIDLKHLKSIISSKTKLMSFASTFNTIGSSQDITSVVELLKQHNIISVIDATQSVGHIPVDVRKWNCDFLFFSAHKALGPTGLGIWFGKLELLKKKDPIHLGGGMNMDYDIDSYTLKDFPTRNFAGTPNISAILSFSKSVDLLKEININKIQSHTYALKSKLESLLTAKHINILNRNIESSILLFSIEGVNAKLVEEYLAEQNILVRSGLFCVKTKNKFINSNVGAIRISLHIYNSEEEIQKVANLLNTTLPVELNKRKLSEEINCFLKY